MRILLPTTEQSCSVETNTHGAVVSSGRRARVSICLALATVLGATASWFSHASAQGLFTEYNVPTKPGSFPLSAVTGPDGALWFVQRNSNTVGRMTTAGVVTEYAIPTVDSGPNQITLGPDGALWFTESAGNNIGRITTTGSFTEYPLPEVGSQPNPIVTGSDGNLWFGENDTITGKIGRITPAGVITEFTLPSGSSAVLSAVHDARTRRQRVVHRTGCKQDRQDYDRRGNYYVQPDEWSGPAWDSVRFRRKYLVY